MIFLSPYCRAHRHVMFLCSLVKIHLKCFSMCSYIDLMKFIISAKGYCLWGCYQQVSGLIKYSCFMSPDESRQCPWLPESSVTDLKIQFTGHCPQTKLQLDLCCTNPPSTILWYYSFACKGRKKKSFTVTLRKLSFIASDLNMSNSPATLSWLRELFSLPQSSRTAQWMCMSHCTVSANVESLK